MAQSLLPFNYENDPTKSKCTALGGLPLFLDLMSSLGLFAALRQCLDESWETKGWSLSDVVLALVLVNLAGGECVEDVERLNSDVGFSKVMELANQSGYSRQQRRYIQRKLAKLSVRKFPSSSSVFRRLELFHDVQEEEEKERRREEAIRTFNQEAGTCLGGTCLGAVG